MIIEFRMLCGRKSPPSLSNKELFNNAAMKMGEKRIEKKNAWKRVMTG